ncbi:MAG: mechanosensitive ion channel family protein [Pirellulales bacterium]
MDWLDQAFDFVAREFQDAWEGSSDSTLVKAAVAGVLLIASYFAAKLISRSVRASLCRGIDETLGKFVGRLTFYAVLIGSTIGILGNAGLNVAGLVGILTAAGFAIGLAFQGTLSNFAAGVLLLVFRPFKVGDMVVVAHLTGRVDEIDLFTTTLDTPDNRRLVIPNSSITGGTIENVTYHPHRRVEVTVGVAYKCSLDDTRAALTKAADAMAGMMIAGEGRGYQIFLSNLGSSSVDWTIRFWTAKENFFLAKEQLTQGIKQQLDAAGLEIPFPQLQLHYAPGNAPANARGGAQVPGMHSVGAPTAESETKGRQETGLWGASIHPLRPRMRRASDSEAA